MHKKDVLKIGLVLILVFLLGACPAAQSKKAQSANYHPSWHLHDILPFGIHKSIWSTMSEDLTLDNIDRPQVRKEIKWFMRRQDYINELTRNAKPYLFYVFQQTRIRKMPAELALLPMIESNYDPFVYSRRGATGLWQMMPGTASGFGIHINWWYDGRRNIVTSTKAALDYLAYLHSYFGNWLLAIAAYDSGEGTVQAAIERNKRHHKPTDFWDLRLPRETKNYVPKLLALAAIIRDPAKYHLSLNPIANQPYFAEFKLKGQYTLNHLADMASTSMSDILQLNPGFRCWATEPKRTFAVLVPKEKADIFKQHMQMKRQPTKWTHHKVALGDTLSKIALKSHTNVAVIKRSNNLKSDTIHIGQDLLIPHSTQKYNRKIKSHYRNIAEDKLPGPKRYTHKVTRHDTLWSIAKKYHVSTSKLRYWNNLSYRQKLKPGEKIIIWKKRRRHHHKHRKKKLS